MSLADYDIDCPKQLTIYDIQGKNVFMENCFLTNEFTVNTKLGQGIYFIRIEDGNHIHLVDLVVQ